MENLANVSQTDIKNGALTCILATESIPDVQEYVQHFNQEIEELVVEEFKHSNRTGVDNNEQIITATDIHKWIADLHPDLDVSIQASLAEEQLSQDIHDQSADLQSIFNDLIHLNISEKQQQQQRHLSTGIQTLMKGLGVDVDDSVQSPLVEEEEQKLKNLQGWCRTFQMVSNDLTQTNVSEKQRKKQ